MVDADEIRRLLDDSKEAEALSRVSLADLAGAYGRYAVRLVASEKQLEWKDDPDGWAAELYFELVEPRDRVRGWSADDEHRRREFLRLIIDGATNDDVLGYIGAGALEDFVSDNDERIRWIEEQALRSAKFRKALASVWISSWASGEVFLRIEAAAGAKLAWPDHYGLRPDERPGGYETPEEAAVAGFFKHQAEVIRVGSCIDGDQARVWLLTRKRPQFWLQLGDRPTRWDDATETMTSDPYLLEEYEAACLYDGGLWRKTDGWFGFSPYTPDDIRDLAAAKRRDSS